MQWCCILAKYLLVRQLRLLGRHTLMLYTGTHAPFVIYTLAADLACCACRDSNKTAPLQPNNQLRFAVSPREQWLLGRFDGGRLLADLQFLHNVSITVRCTKHHDCPECCESCTGMVRLLEHGAGARLNRTQADVASPAVRQVQLCTT